MVIFRHKHHSRSIGDRIHEHGSEGNVEHRACPEHYATCAEALSVNSFPGDDASMDIVCVNTSGHHQMSSCSKCVPQGGSVHPHCTCREGSSVSREVSEYSMSCDSLGDGNMSPPLRSASRASRTSNASMTEVEVDHPTRSGGIYPRSPAPVVYILPQSESTSCQDGGTSYLDGATTYSLGGVSGGSGVSTFCGDESSSDTITIDSSSNKEISRHTRRKNSQEGRLTHKL